MAHSSAACSIAAPARPASPNARARRCSIRACPKTKSWPSCSTSPKASASVRPVAWSASVKIRWCATACGRATTPNNSTTSSWLFPPHTREVQFDEKWAFVAKKEKHCDRSAAADDRCGDCWDHVALDPEHRLVVSAVVGRHAAEHVDMLVADFRRRTEGRLMNLMTSDENPAYVEAILANY